VIGAFFAGVVGLIFLFLREVYRRDIAA
jgi:hypothetical protein